MPNKRILILSSWYPSKLSAYNGNFVQRHVEAIATTNQVTVLIIIADEGLKDKNYNISREVINNVSTIYVYYKLHNNGVKNYLHKLNAFRIGFKLVGEFDLVHVNVIYPAGLFALYIKWFYGKKYIVTEHWTAFTSTKKDFFSKFKLFLIRLIAKNSAQLMPVSEHLKNGMINFGLNGNYSIVPNVINTDLFYPKEKKEKRRKEFLHISALNDAHKNIFGIINACKLLENEGLDFLIKIGGDGDILPYKEMVNKLNLEKYIHFFEEKTLFEVADLMRDADCFLLFSNYETFGCVVYEAISCGTPVIVPNLPCFDQIPKDYRFLVNKADEAMLARLIKQFVLIDSHKLNELQKQKMHQYIRTNFGVNTVVNKFDAVYEKIT